MADKNKELEKTVADPEKRVKMRETKVKALADNMTDPKEINAFMTAMAKTGEKSAKDQERPHELGRKHAEAGIEKSRKDTEKLIAKERADAGKPTKDLVTKAEFQRLEAMVHSAHGRR